MTEIRTLQASMGIIGRVIWLIREVSKNSLRMKSWSQDLLGKGTYGKELVYRSWNKKNLQSLEQLKAGKSKSDRR